MTWRAGNRLCRVAAAQFVRGISEFRHQHTPVGHVEIGVAGRQTLIVDGTGWRRGQRDDLKRLGRPRFVPLQPRAVCLAVLIFALAGSSSPRWRSVGDRRTEPAWSTWPSVSSPASPWPSQTTCWRPGCSAVCSPIPLRSSRDSDSSSAACFGGQSRVPCPLTSIEPPSSVIPPEIGHVSQHAGHARGSGIVGVKRRVFVGPRN